MIVIIIILIIAQCIQWIWALICLYEGGCSSKVEFLVLLIPFMFIFYLFGSMRFLINEFRGLEDKEKI